MSGSVYSGEAISLPQSQHTIVLRLLKGTTVNPSVSVTLMPSLLYKPCRLVESHTAVMAYKHHSRNQPERGRSAPYRYRVLSSDLCRAWEAGSPVRVRRG